MSFDSDMKRLINACYEILSWHHLKLVSILTCIATFPKCLFNTHHKYFRTPFCNYNQYTNTLPLMYVPIFIITDFELISTITTVNPKPVKQEQANDPLYVINQVTKIHMVLTYTAHLINKAFCFQQLLKIAISFVSIISALFLFAMVFAVKDPSKLRMDILFFMWVMSNALEIFLVVWISAKTCKEVRLS